MSDRVLLAQAVSNSINNAITYNERDNWILITTETTPDCAVLRIANSGPVIPAERVGELLEPFRRL